LVAIPATRVTHSGAARLNSTSTILLPASMLRNRFEAHNQAADLKTNYLSRYW
jgi:hypothetical protein